MWLSTPHNTVPFVAELVKNASTQRPGHCIPAKGVAAQQPNDAAACQDATLEWLLLRSDGWHFAAEPPLQLSLAAGLTDAPFAILRHLSLDTIAIQVTRKSTQPSSHVEVTSVGDAVIDSAKSN
jgi:hypothetical protein